MNIGRGRSILFFSFVLLLGILINPGIGADNAAGITPSLLISRSGDGQGFDNLEVAEHRISLTQENDLNRISVQDEFWIRNRGSKPYYGLVYNWLPDDIDTSEGMTCKVSETGGHSCFGWSRDRNNYYWDTQNVILPENYAKQFDFEIEARSIDEPEDTTSYTRKVDSGSTDSDIMVETDEWGWVREGFTRGWKSILNFSVVNNAGKRSIYEINNSGIPAGLTLEMYADSNEDGWLNNNDTLVGYDSDHDGYWEAASTFDSNKNGIPDINLESNEKKTFFVYIKANYMLHFFSLYEKMFEPTENGTIKISKETLYGTSLMRVFVIPKTGPPVGIEEISFQKRSSGNSDYYYGEWEGDQGTEISFELMGALPNTGEKKADDNQDGGRNSDNQLAITLMLVAIGIVLTIFIILRKRLTRKMDNVTNTSENSSERISHDINEEKTGERKRKSLEALMGLEDDYESGSLDEEVYLELRERYIDIYEKQS